MSKHRQRHKLPNDHVHTCPTCQNQYLSDYCNACGEKIFHEHDLSLPHLLEDAVDKFTHLDLKIPRSIALLFRPGYLTQKFLTGVRKPYSNPVQLFIIVNVIFFFCQSVSNFTDYTPNLGDYRYSGFSNFKLLQWMEPADDYVISAIGKLEDEKLPAIFKASGVDMASIPKDSLPNANNRLSWSKEVRNRTAGYSKTLIVLLIPLNALVLFAVLFRRFKYFGSSLIFATHFVSFNILTFGLWEVLYRCFHFNIFKYFEYFFFDSFLKPVSFFLMGDQFEGFHFFFLMPYLLIAFHRLFKLKWWHNILVSYFMVRATFFISFAVYKKIITVILLYSYN